jgi:glycosyltransferase involved in cell wall biosynthesis
MMLGDDRSAVTERPAQAKQEVMLSLFVACYNEAENIADTLDTLFSALEEFDFVCEVLVIDDASRDRSVEIIRQYQKNNPSRSLELVVNERNRGLSYNFVEGAFRTQGRYYRMVCGDNVESKDTLTKVFRRLGEADMVITYPERRVGFSATRNMVSKMYTMLINLITGHSIRYYNSPTIHTRRNAMRWHSRSHGFGFQADLITKLLDDGASYIELPVVATERQNGESTALTLKNFLSVAHMLINLVAWRLRRMIYGS